MAWHKRLLWKNQYPSSYKISIIDAFKFSLDNSIIFKHFATPKDTIFLIWVYWSARIGNPKSGTV